MENKTVQIDPRVALAEAFALAEFYRNRNLVHANKAFAQADEIARLKVSIDEAATRIAELSGEFSDEPKKPETE